MFSKKSSSSSKSAHSAPLAANQPEMPTYGSSFAIVHIDDGTMQDSSGSVSKKSWTVSVTCSDADVGLVLAQGAAEINRWLFGLAAKPALEQVVVLVFAMMADSGFVAVPGATELARIAQWNFSQQTAPVLFGSYTTSALHARIFTKAACDVKPLEALEEGWFSVIEGQPFALNRAYDSVTFHAGTTWCRSFVVLCNDVKRTGCPTGESFNTSYNGEMQTDKFVAGGSIGLLVEDVSAVSVVCAVHFPGRRPSQYHRCDMNVCFGSTSCLSPCPTRFVATATRSAVAPFTCVSVDNEGPVAPTGCVEFGIGGVRCPTIAPIDRVLGATDNSVATGMGISFGVILCCCLAVCVYIKTRSRGTSGSFVAIPSQFQQQQQQQRQFQQIHGQQTYFYVVQNAAPTK